MVKASLEGDEGEGGHGRRVKSEVEDRIEAVAREEEAVDVVEGN